ncbi:hypothetical protein R3P38DRAFT_2802355 [Favolaschia claudopus]|uniref:Uncharacterized protein n=1 Tax=Favolaschia claudopus TaxID=2862362 RepID=A0AAV9ZVE3_9AGAR
MSLNGDQSVNEEYVRMNDGHYAEDAWAASNDFLTGPHLEMPAGTRHDALEPNLWMRQPTDSFETTLSGIRVQLQNLSTEDGPRVDGMEASMRQLFSAIRADKVDSYHDGDDDASSVAVDDHASVVSNDGSEEGRDHGDCDNSDSPSIPATTQTPYADLERQFQEDLEAIDAAERAWMRLMAALRRIETLKGQPDTREQLKEVLVELQSMRGTFY